MPKPILHSENLLSPRAIIIQYNVYTVNEEEGANKQTLQGQDMTCETRNHNATREFYYFVSRDTRSSLYLVPQNSEFHQL
jgi:hypothetical protein